MDVNLLKCVIGESKTGEAATIRFSGRITEESATQFNQEFEFLENVVQPSVIRVLINSEGGSVLHGMTTYSVIQGSSIKTECIIEGMAASMASVLWAAGNVSFMRDYGILMIHNPFLPSATEDEGRDLVKAFTKQIEMIYRKRFGLTKEQVQAIMKGENKEGTFFDAKEAVKAGIIPAENVIATSKQLCEQVKNELSATRDIATIQNLMAKISDEYSSGISDFKPFPEDASNLLKKNTNLMSEQNKGIEFGAIAATLGLKDAEVKEVMARISELTGAEAKLTEVNKTVKDLQTVLAGKEATVQNLQKDLQEVKTKLDIFEKREAQEKDIRIKTLVENAIRDGKIEKEGEAQWVEMANSNFTLAEKTLSSIPAREVISKEIATDPANVKATSEAAKTAEQKMTEQVKKVVGENFEFKKIK